MIRQGKSFAALAAVGALLLVGCRSDDSGSSSDETTASTTASSEAATTTAAAGDTTTPASTADTTETTASEDTTPETDAPEAERWTAPLDNCEDPDAATAPIEGELVIGSAQPLSGTPAVAFAPVKEGFELYINYANTNNLLDGVTLTADIRDDQYDATQTPGVVDSLIDEGVSIFSGIIGSPNNLAVRDTLNEQCIPQLLNLTGAPDWGAVEEYPWTTGALVPYDIEAKIYAGKLKELFGEGATVGIYAVNNEFGKTFIDAFKEAADEAGLEIVEEQSIEPLASDPPINQVQAIAAKAPQAIVAVPLGAQCPTFLKELANAKAANAGFAPAVFLTNTCASRLLISALAAGAGDGVYTSANLIDPSDPKFDGVPGLGVFKEQYAAAGLAGDVGTTATGWSVGESTVNILIAAQESGTLTRQSIIEAARNLEYTPTLGREGTVYKMNGEEDGFAFQSLTVVQWNEATATFTELGAEDTSFES
jgi:branched-chain amino acid transport system substrate-binding protein